MILVTLSIVRGRGPGMSRGTLMEEYFRADFFFIGYSKQGDSFSDLRLTVNEQHFRYRSDCVDSLAIIFEHVAR